MAEGRCESRDRRGEGGDSALHLGVRHSQERAEQGRCARVAERDAPAVGAGSLRRGHGLQRLSHQCQDSGRNGKAHRLQRRRAQAPDRSRLRLSGEERRRAEGVVGQDVQRLSPAARARWSIMVAVAAPPARTGAPGWTAAATVAPASIVVTIGIVLPIVILFRYSLNQYTPAKVMVDAFTTENYAKVLSDPFYLAVLFRTIRVAALCTVICLVLAFPMAYCLARTRSRFKNLLLMAVILPLFVGNAVRAAGWMVLFGNRGFVNSILTGGGITRQPLQIMYTEFAVVVGVIAVNLPFVVLTLQAELQWLHRAIQEAALGLGARPLGTVHHILP